MQLEHKLIGGILTGLLLVGCLFIGIFVFRHMLDQVPLAKFKLFPIILAVAFLPLATAFYYLNNFMSDGHSGIRGALIPALPVYAVCVVGWFASYLSRRRDSNP